MQAGRAQTGKAGHRRVLLQALVRAPLRTLLRISPLAFSAASFRAALPLALPLALGLLLRLWFVHRDPVLTGDPLIYGAIARNLLQHGVYGLVPDAPTLIRLPGYPLFLAACFRLFGIDRYYPVLYLQVFIDLLGCVLLSRLAACLVPWPLQHRAATAAMWLSALCPFTACYTAAPLTETLELFSVTAALFCFARALGLNENKQAPHSLTSKQGFEDLAALKLNPSIAVLNLRWLAAAVLAWTVAALLRPDGALLAVVLCPALVFYGIRRGAGKRAGKRAFKRSLKLAALSALASLLAFVPWTLRNWHTFHVFEPLAPRYATDPGEPINPGFQRWTKTVCADLVCTSEVYWAADDAPIGIDELPARAFDTGPQLRATADLLADYNRTTTITPALDARFQALADERIVAHPFRYYGELPLLRLADMWFRPRVELFNIDLRWWRYRSEGKDSILAWAFALWNVAYLALGVAGGALRKPPLLGIFASFILLRCMLLLTIEAPEPRYTLECFPVIFVLGALAIAHFPSSRKEKGKRPA